MTLSFSNRGEDVQQALATLLQGALADVWVSLVGIVQSFNDKAGTVQVQPAIQQPYRGPNLAQQNLNLPLLDDVPVYFPRGGDYTMTFPIKAGDECLVVFSSRCIDNWWGHGGVQSQFERRMHDLSDGFAFVGPFSQKTIIQNISTTTVQIRTNDGKIFVELDQPNNKVSTFVGASSLVLDGNANLATLNADLRVNGKINSTGDTVAGTISLQQHTHSHSGGNGNSGPPNQ